MSHRRFLLSPALVALMASAANAQTAVPPFEVAVVGALRTFDDFNPFLEKGPHTGHPVVGLPPADPPAWTERGLGARFGYRLTTWLVVEAEAVWFRFAGNPVLVSVDDPFNGDLQWRGGHKAQMQTGPALGWRFSRVALLATVKGGVSHYNRFPRFYYADLGPPATVLAAAPERSGSFRTVNAGGILQVDVTPRYFARLDLGVSRVYFKDSLNVLGHDYWRGDVVASTSLGWRF